MKGKSRQQNSHSWERKSADVGTCLLGLCWLSYSPVNQHQELCWACWPIYCIGVSLGLERQAAFFVSTHQYSLFAG
jgi:hypothetical protein